MVVNSCCFHVLVSIAVFFVGAYYFLPFYIFTKLFYTLLLLSIAVVYNLLLLSLLLVVVYIRLSLSVILFYICLVLSVVVVYRRLLLGDVGGVQAVRLLRGGPHDVQYNAGLEDYVRLVVSSRLVGSHTVRV